VLIKCTHLPEVAIERAIDGGATVSAHLRVARAPASVLIKCTHLPEIPVERAIDGSATIGAHLRVGARAPASHTAC
jgi:hypothetical protein